ncbi:MAG: transporter substrate-binding domain-containing protein [Desulfobacula sp.]|nr:transporter substrate-binding domain-containing protein [Desulfobacula sp.]
MKGILIDIVTDVIQNQMGIQVSHEGYPWARAQLLVKNNEADAFVTVPTPERRKYTKISSEPIFSLAITSFTSKKNKDINDLKNVKTFSDLKKFTLINYIGNGWAKKNLADLNVYWVPSLDKTLELLAYNRYQVYVGSSKTVHYNLKRLGFQDKVLEIPNVIDSVSLHLCIGKESAFVHIIPKFNETIIAERKKGNLQKIFNKYR